MCPPHTQPPPSAQLTNRVQDQAQSRALPQEVRWAVLCLFAHVALHVLVPIMMEFQRDLFVAQFQRMSPGQPPNQVIATVNIVLVAGLIYHLIFGGLFLWLALKIYKGRNWARIVVTVVSVLGSVGTFFSFSSPTPTPELYKTLNIISWLLALATVGLLWLPPRSRAYFIRGQCDGD
jgi:hypothetical protein